MKYNLADQADAGRALAYLLELSQNKSLCEIKKVSPKRTLNQNSYLHILLGAFAQHFGWQMDEAKTVYKRDINPEIYVYEKNGAKFLKSSADLTKEEMMKSIDRLHDFSKEHGYPLPPATDENWLRSIENAMEQQARYL